MSQNTTPLELKNDATNTTISNESQPPTKKARMINLSGIAKTPQKASTSPSPIAPTKQPQVEIPSSITNTTTPSNSISTNNISTPPSTQPEPEGAKFINVPGSVRSDGTVRKPRKIKLGYNPQDDAKKKEKEATSVPPSPSNLILNSQSNSISQPLKPISQTDLSTPITSLANSVAKKQLQSIETTNSSNSTNKTASTIKTEQLEEENDDEIEIDVVSDAIDDNEEFQEEEAEEYANEEVENEEDFENGEENQNGPRIRPNVQFFARLMRNTNTWNTKLIEEENAAAEEKLKAKERTDLTEEELESELHQDIEATVKQTTTSILKEIDKIRRLEGITLLNAIAKRYGINIEIIPETSDNRKGKRSLDENNPKNLQKKRKLTNNSANQRPAISKQIRIKKVQGKIGYGAD